jgi:cytoplasmic iron level regulating protein YaaA (DUF328/UPF0246 family)
VSRPFLLLPPSEGKADGGRGPRADARPGPLDAELASARDVVRLALRDALASADDAAATKLLGVRGDNLVRARAATDAYVRGSAPVLPAWRRYTGVVWDHLGPLRAPEAKRVLVPSALYGITTAADPIADYRLKFSVALPGIGGLARLWKEPCTAALVAHVHGRGRPIVDLLPAEHAAAFDWAVLESRAPVVHVRFRSRDGARVVGHDAKAVKGAVARCVLEQGVDALGAFRWQGWRARAVPGESAIDVLAPR